MDWKEIYNENDSFEQIMHDTLLMIALIFVDLDNNRFTPSQALSMVNDMINTFAQYATEHMEDDAKYHRDEKDEKEN